MIKHKIPLDIVKSTNNINFIIEIVNDIQNKSAENYIKDKLEELGIEVRKINGINGDPDFICKYKNKTFYVEAKGYDDGLRINQIDWILKNKDKLIYIYYLTKKQNKIYGGYKCEKCGEEWIPIKKETPIVCPKCNSPYNIMKIELKIEGYKCERCSHEWIPRKKEHPVTCPKCKSAYWDRQRINKKVK